MPTEVLTLRALNRATLARQHLLERTSADVPTIVEHLVGLQAQAPLAPYYGLWSRVEGFVPDDLARLLWDRRVVRATVMRGTIHLVTAADVLGLRTLVQPVLDAALRGRSANTVGLERVDLADLAAVGREVLEAEPLTNTALRAALADRFEGVAPEVLAFAVRALLPLVQVPPRGVWGRSGQPVLTTAEAWLGDAVGGVPPIDDLVLRYLGAFGPATVADLRTWSGLTGLGEVVDRLAPRLRTFVDEDGRTLVDLPDAPRPDAGVDAPARLVAEFDNLVLSHADRRRVIADADRTRVFGAVNGIIPGTVLVDGFVAGTWKLTVGAGRSGAAGPKRGARTPPGRRAEVVARTFRRLAARQRHDVGAEAMRLLEFAAPDVEDHVAVIEDP